MVSRSFVFFCFCLSAFHTMVMGKIAERDEMNIKCIGKSGCLCLNLASLYYVVVDGSG